MDTWAAIATERLDLVDRLSGLTDEQWNSPSLCDQWRVRDVLAHVTAGAQGAYGVGPTVSGVLRHGFRFNRWMAEDGRSRGQQDPAAIVAALKAAASNRKSPPGAPVVSVLTDVMIHGQDICRPLGIYRALPPESLSTVAQFVQKTFVFGAKKRTAGLRLAATDVDWSHGTGPEVTGPAEALIMVMAGRMAAFDDLEGDGKATLAGRY